MKQLTFSVVFFLITLLNSQQLTNLAEAAVVTFPPRDFPIKQIRPIPTIVTFHQVNFEYDTLGRIVATDWGEMEVDPKKLASFTDDCSGYINVFLHTDTPIATRDNAIHWVVDNLFIPGPAGKGCALDDDEIKDALRSDPFTRSRGASLRSDRVPDEIPMTKEFPNVE